MLNVYFKAKFYLNMAQNQKGALNKMQLPEDFLAFNFELTNSRVFQQNVMPASYDSVVTVA